MSNLILAETFTRQAEGGFTVDNGGPTNYGVTQGTYDAYRESVNLPRQSVSFISQAEVSTIMSSEYWLPAGCDKLPRNLSICQFDTSFNSGPSRAVKLLQETLGVPADGMFGPETEAAVAACDDDNTASAYLDHRWAFMKNICMGEPPTQRLNGYRNRIAALRVYLSHLPSGVA